MIPYTQFGKLRLTQFLSDTDISELSGWERRDELWVGEAVGFSEWLRLESDPTVLRSLALDFAELSLTVVSSVLEAVRLAVRPGMTAKELRALFGKPTEVDRFVSDRVTYEFVVPGPPRYILSCTVLKRGGLTYLVVMRP